MFSEEESHPAEHPSQLSRSRELSFFVSTRPEDLCRSTCVRR